MKGAEIVNCPFVRIFSGNRGRGNNYNTRGHSSAVIVPPGLYRVEAVVHYSVRDGSLYWIQVRGVDRQGNLNGRLYGLYPEQEFDAVPVYSVGGEK